MKFESIYKNNIKGMLTKIDKWWKDLKVKKNMIDIEPTQQKAINNITETELVTLEGKEYYRVKVKFVDSMSFDLAKHLDTKETQNIELVKQIDTLQLENKKLTILNTDLNRLNINLFTEVMILKAEKRELNKLKAEIHTKDDEINFLLAKIKELNKIINEQQLKAKEYRKLKAAEKELEKIKQEELNEINEVNKLIESKEFDNLLNEYQLKAIELKKEKKVIGEIGFKLLTEIALQKAEIDDKIRQLAEKQK